jgi:hypothetical protein
MGVGFPVDLVVCVALGVDQFDCVYPSRTGRFGTALVRTGTLNLKVRACKEFIFVAKPHRVLILFDIYAVRSIQIRFPPYRGRLRMLSLQELHACLLAPTSRQGANWRSASDIPQYRLSNEANERLENLHY